MSETVMLGLHLTAWRHVFSLLSESDGSSAPVAVACALELKSLRLSCKTGRLLTDALIDHIKASISWHFHPSPAHLKPRPSKKPDVS